MFPPPPPQAKPKADPMARGKGADVLSLDEMIGEGKPGALVDVVLEPGQVGMMQSMVLRCSFVLSLYIAPPKLKITI